MKKFFLSLLLLTAASGGAVAQTALQADGASVYASRPAAQTQTATPFTAYDHYTPDGTFYMND